MRKNNRQDDSLDDVRGRVLAAALPHVAFDGWSDRTLADAMEDAGVDPDQARLAFPRGGVDLAAAFHRAMDQELAARAAAEDISALRYSEKVAHLIALRLHLIAPYREAVRRAAALFALPTNAPEGARLVWETADTIWTALGDTSDDINWYTKRMTLSAVWSSVLLYWLGDTSEDMGPTRAFIDRRIENVMQFEKAKSAIRATPLGKALSQGAERLLSGVRAPGSPPEDLPGRWRDPPA